jgi:hypothetical protein
MCPISAENKKIIVPGKIAEIEFQRSRELLQSGVFQGLSQTYYPDRGIDLSDCIGIGCNNIGIESLCHSDNNFLPPANRAKIIMKDRNSRNRFTLSFFIGISGNIVKNRFIAHQLF